MSKSLSIHCADIGSVARNNFGWARGISAGRELAITGGSNIGDLVDSVIRDLNSSHSVALGFECPLYVLISEDPKLLTSARPGEGNRAWSAAAGAAALATGLTETVWILVKIRKGLNSDASPFLDWQAFHSSRTGGLFLWEALVSSQPEGQSHQDDAAIAVRAFAAAYPNIDAANAVHVGRDAKVHSLIGAALLRTGWSEDINLLTQPCVVIRAK
ncbi:MAG: hypothetical protein ACLP5H_23260 [Desulfomonilaceae bacterium]